MQLWDLSKKLESLIMYGDLSQPELWHLYEKLVNAEFVLKEGGGGLDLLGEIMDLQSDVLELITLRGQDGRVLR